jgi:hypothetical protein
LANLEENKIIKRGSDYIEGIARVFEARNYLCILTALLSSGATQLGGWYWGIAVGAICIIFCLKLMSGSSIGDIADIEAANVHFKNSLLMVEDVVIMNVGLPATREKILNEGLGLLIKPKNDNARLTLDAPGQRMAIIHDVVSILGSKVEISETELMPLARKHVDKGYLAFFIVANEPDLDYLREIIRKVPVLENTRGTTLNTFYGRKAAD